MAVCLLLLLCLFLLLLLCLFHKVAVCLLLLLLCLFHKVAVCLLLLLHSKRARNSSGTIVAYNSARCPGERFYAARYPFLPLLAVLRGACLLLVQHKRLQQRRQLAHATRPTSARAGADTGGLLRRRQSRCRNVLLVPRQLTCRAVQRNLAVTYPYRRLLVQHNLHAEAWRRTTLLQRLVRASVKPRRRGCVRKCCARLKPRWQRAALLPKPLLVFRWGPS